MSTHQPSTTTDREPLRGIAMLVGIVFLIVGILGFIPGITTNTDDLEFAGHESHAELLGIFQVSILHNIVHLLFGVAGLALAAPSPAPAPTSSVAVRSTWCCGSTDCVIDHDSDVNFVPLNDADNWLHLGLGVGMVALGLLVGRKREEGITRGAA